MGQKGAPWLVPSRDKAHSDLDIGINAKIMGL